MRRALIVGINHYSFSPLSGCINDAKEVSRLLATNEDGTPNFDCQLMTSKEGDTNKEQISRYSLKKEIHKLFTNDADVALLYFSGWWSKRFRRIPHNSRCSSVR